MKINEVAKRTGLHQPTIRLYEERGLISPELEEKNGRMFRNYSEADVERLKVIAGLRKALFSMEQIKLMYDDPSLIPALLDSHRKKVDSLADELLSLKHVLDEIDPAPESPKALQAALQNTAAETMPLPKADIHPRFRYLDELYPPEKDDGRTLRLPPRIKFITKSYFIFLPIFLALAVLAGYFTTRQASGRASVVVQANKIDVYQYRCDEVPPDGTNRMWQYRELYSTALSATLQREERDGAVIWTLTRCRKNASGEVITITTRTDSPKYDGFPEPSYFRETTYTYQGKPAIYANVTSQILDKFIENAALLDAPVSRVSIKTGVWLGLALLLVFHLMYFAGKVYVTFYNHWARYRKMADGGYRASHMIEDDDQSHVYGPGEDER